MREYMPDKNYINGIIIKANGYGLKCSIKTKDFVEQLEAITNAEGWCKIEIKKRREPSDKGVTHYVIEDTFTPNRNNDNF